MPRIAVNGITLDYTDTGGDGRPVLLVHGWPLNRSAWTAQESALAAAGHRVLAYDRRGFGNSDKPESGYDVDTLTDDLAGLLDHLDLAEVTLVGSCIGASEVLRYLSVYGDARVRSAVILGTVSPFLLRTDDNPHGVFDESHVARQRARVVSDRAAYVDDFVTRMFTAGDAVHASDELRREVLAWAASASDHALLGCLDALVGADLRDDLDGVTVPTLVVHGGADAIAPLGLTGWRAFDGLGEAELVVVDGAPHGLTLTHGDEVNRALLAFLG